MANTLYDERREMMRAGIALAAAAQAAANSAQAAANAAQADADNAWAVADGAARAVADAADAAEERSLVAHTLYDERRAALLEEARRRGRPEVVALLQEGSQGSWLVVDMAEALLDKEVPHDAQRILSQLQALDEGIRTREVNRGQ